MLFWSNFTCIYWNFVIRNFLIQEREWAGRGWEHCNCDPQVLWKSAPSFFRFCDMQSLFVMLEDSEKQNTECVDWCGLKSRLGKTHTHSFNSCDAKQKHSTEWFLVLKLFTEKGIWGEKQQNATDTQFQVQQTQSRILESQGTSLSLVHGCLPRIRGNMF